MAKKDTITLDGMAIDFRKSIKPKPNTRLYYEHQVDNAYVAGYNQAEKDLELTWEEIYSILYFEREVLREFGNEEHSNEEVCKEVLKRFKEQRYEEKNV